MDFFRWEPFSGAFKKGTSTYAHICETTSYCCQESPFRSANKERFCATHVELRKAYAKFAPFVRIQLSSSGYLPKSISSKSY